MTRRHADLAAILAACCITESLAHADVPFAQIPSLNVNTQYQSILLDSALIPEQSAYIAVQVTMNWQNVSGATSAGARFILASAPASGSSPPASPQFCYIAPTTWSSGAGPSSSPVFVTLNKPLTVAYIRNAAAPALYFCCRQTAGSARWSNVQITLLAHPQGGVVNDTPAGAIDVSHLSTPFVTPVADAGRAAPLINDEPSPGCAAAARRQVWFRYVAPRAGWFRFSTCAADLQSLDALPGFNDTVVSAWSGSPGSLMPAACADDGGCPDIAASERRSRITCQLAAGEGVYVAVATKEATPSELFHPSNWLAMHVSEVPPPPAAPTNIGGSTAETIPSDGPFPFSDLRATTGIPANSPDLPAGLCAPSFNHTLWYRFVPAESGRYRFTTCPAAAPFGTVSDTALVVMNGPWWSQTVLACSDNADGNSPHPCDGGATARSNLIVDLQAWSEYIIVLGRVGTPFGPTETTAQLVVDRVGPIGKCQPADVAADDGTPLPTDTALHPNNGVNEGDYNAFFQGFFDAAAHCNIANDDGTPLPPFGPSGVNSGTNEGDYNQFFMRFFDGC